MPEISIYYDRPWCPFFVFIKTTSISDRELLRSLSCPSYVSLSSIEGRSDYFGIANDGQWTHLVDNWAYTHWHSKEFHESVRKIALRFDIFSFLVGDSDMSFNLFFYKGGVQVRRFIWDDPDYSGGRLGEEFGSPLLEDSIDRGQDPFNGLWKVTSSLGIETDYTKLSFSFYAPSRSPWV